MQRVRGFANRAPRVDLRRPAVVINSDGRECDVTILDVSSGGFRLEVSDLLRIGECATLRVDRGEEFPVQIRWALGDQAGGTFLTSAGCELWGEGEGVMSDGNSDPDEGEERRKVDRRRGGDRRSVERTRADGSSAERRDGDRRNDAGS